MDKKRTRLILVQVMTDPQSLFFLIRGQVQFMRERGIDTVGISSPGPYLAKFAERDSVDVVSVPMGRAISPIRDILSVIGLWRAIRRINPDIVQAGTPKGGLIGMIASWMAGTRVRIYTIRGMPLETATGLGRPLFWITEWTACRLSTRVVCVSRLLREYAIQRKLCKPGKIITFGHGSGNGVDAVKRFNPDSASLDTRLKIRENYGIPDSAVVIGYVGRLIGIKGIFELTNAWQAIRLEYPDVHMLMIGPFEPHDPIPARTLSILKEDPRVHLTGQTDDAAPFYIAMDLLVLPTYREGVPNVLLEASSMRLPIVSTMVPGPLDVVENGITGFLVPPRDAQALATAIRRYLDNPTLRTQHGVSGRNHVLKEFSQEKIWESWYQEYISQVDSGPSA